VCLLGVVSVKDLLVGCRKRGIKTGIVASLFEPCQQDGQLLSGLTASPHALLPHAEVKECNTFSFPSLGCKNQG